MSKNKLGLSILIIFATIAVSGCSISFKTEEGGGNDGGVYVTANKGNTWQQRVLIPTISGRPGSIGHLSTNFLAMDPSDEKAIYFGSINNGLLYSYDGGKNWRLVKELGKISVKAVAIDPGSKCIIYAASGNKVYKSTDCSRTWEQVYYDNDITTTINAITIDHYNSANVYIGTSRGEIIKSLNRGLSWQTAGRFNDSIEEIIISPHDSRIVFTATVKKGIYRSNNSGGSWVDLSENLKDFENSMKFRDLALGKAAAGRVLLATNYGLLKSDDNGDSWVKIELITPEKEAIINAITVSPKDSKEIYYVTSTTFYRSLDGGVNWTTKKLPTTQAGWKLLIDPEDTNIIYLGVRKIK